MVMPRKTGIKMLNGTGKKRKPTVNNVKYFLGVVWVTKVTQDTLTSK